MPRTERTATAVGAALLALLGVVPFAACGGDGTRGPTEGATALVRPSTVVGGSGSTASGQIPVHVQPAATPPSSGVIEDPSLGFLIHYPLQWTALEDSVSTSEIYYPKQDRWQFHTFIRESTLTTYVGESLTLFVRVVTSASDQGKTAIAGYFASIDLLPTGSSTVAYEVIANGNQSVRKVGEVTVAKQPAVLIEGTAPPGFRGEPFNVRAYYVMRNQDLFVIGFVGPTLQLLQDDGPTVDPIVSSFLFVNSGR